jgi:hypothetical protein
MLSFSILPQISCFPFFISFKLILPLWTDARVSNTAPKVPYSRECCWPAQLGSRNTHDDGRGQNIQSAVKNTSLCHCMTQLFVSKKPKPNLCTALATQNTTTRTKHDWYSATCILCRNRSVTGHKQGTIAFPQSKPLPRSTGNSTRNI